MSPNYLHRCFLLHGKLRSIYYSKNPRREVSEIEKRLEGVKSNKRLRYEDLEQIVNPDVWDAEDFGYWPPRRELEQSLESKTWDFWNQPKNEEDLIQGLLEVFHQIELVSVVLRFIVPKHFGIMSPPVENVLGIGPSTNHAQKYQRYLASLREVRDSHPGFAKAAEVDMALWVLQVGVLDGVLEAAIDDGECEELRLGYEQDAQLRAVRVLNLTEQLFEDMSRPDLAEALLDSASFGKQPQRRVDLAGQIAGIEFERFVGQLAGKRPNEERRLADMVAKVRPRRLESPVSWRSAVNTRNKAVHLENPSVQDIRRLIAAMNEAKRQAEDQADRLINRAPP